MRKPWGNVKAFYSFGGLYKIDDVPPTTEVIDLIYNITTYNPWPRRLLWVVLILLLGLFSRWSNRIFVQPWWISLERRVERLEETDYFPPARTMLWVIWFLNELETGLNEKRRVRDYVRYLSLEDVPIDATVDMFKSDPRFLYTRV